MEQSESTKKVCIIDALGVLQSAPNLQVFINTIINFLGDYEEGRDIFIYSLQVFEITGG